MVPMAQQHSLIIYFLLLGFFFNNKVIGQNFQHAELNSKIRIGLNYGQASQAKFPFNNTDYLYENNYFKLQFNTLLFEKRNFSFELHVEPSIYFSEHQLLNRFFIRSNRGIDFLDQRDIFVERRMFKEYVLNVGLLVRYNLWKELSVYIIGSVGPIIADADTERLKKGFAFSDIIGLGFFFKTKPIWFDVRTTLRHNSNANFSFPNNGHNSVGFEVGVSFPL